MKLSLADQLSLLRIPLAVLFLVFSDFNTILIIILFLVALTDFLDGRIARKNNIASKHGAIIDPLADKVFTVTAFLLFLYKKDLTLIQFLLLIIRDIYSIIEIMISLIKNSKKSHKASIFGKLTTVLQYILILVLILELNIKNGLVILIVIFSIITIIDYINKRWFRS